MTELVLALPEELARRAKEAGLLSSEAIEALLRERLRSQAGKALREIWAGGPQEQLTPEIEQGIVETVRTVRVQRRAQRKRADRS
ncbi:MAG: hypothetical protein EXR36_13095 [Betaproteobacteria bacterium]|nr:hypothetical protein [Betaproteobacteria bacterium]